MGHRSAVHESDVVVYHPGYDRSGDAPIDVADHPCEEKPKPGDVIGLYAPSGLLDGEVLRACSSCMTVSFRPVLLARIHSFTWGPFLDWRAGNGKTMPIDAGHSNDISVPTAGSCPWTHFPICRWCQDGFESTDNRKKGPGEAPRRKPKTITRLIRDALGPCEPDGITPVSGIFSRGMYSTTTCQVRAFVRLSPSGVR